MFGNLTTSVQGSVAPPAPTTPTQSPKVVTGKQRVITPKEQVRLEVLENISNNGRNCHDHINQHQRRNNKYIREYTVGILENNELVGSTTTSGNNWEFSKNSDWSEENTNHCKHTRRTL